MVQYKNSTVGLSKQQFCLIESAEIHETSESRISMDFNAKCFGFISSTIQADTIALNIQLMECAGSWFFRQCFAYKFGYIANKCSLLFIGFGIVN